VNPGDDQQGFSMLEVLVSMAVLLLAVSGITGLLIHNGRTNRSQQIAAEVQANARACMTVIMQKLRTAGWDPGNAAISTLTLDPDDEDANDADGVAEIVIYADYDANGTTDGADEEVTIRHVGDRIEWKTSSAGAFAIVAVNITNDADDDGTVEPLFVADSITNPTRLTVQVTARSAELDPRTGDFRRWTLTSDVALRSAL